MSCVKRGCLGCLGVLVVILAIGFIHTYIVFHTSREYTIDVESANLRFHTLRIDSTVVISFGDKSSPVLRNYVEVNRGHDTGGDCFFFFFDRTTGTPKVKHILFLNERFYDFHIPDYECRFQVYPMENDVMFMNNYVYKKIPKEDFTECPTSDYFVVQVKLAPYDKGIEYGTFELNHITDLDSVMELVTPRLVSYYPEMIEKKVELDFQENVKLYNNPIKDEIVNVSEENKRTLMREGWLFLDTMNLKKDLKIEKATWNRENGRLTIFYKLENDSTRIPINGVTYSNNYKLSDERFNYK